MTSPRKWIALLRGINVGGGNRVPMAELREVAGQLGWDAVATYIQSGNVVFSARESVAERVETSLEQAIADHFNLTIPVIARMAAEWGELLPENPFAEESANEPNRVMLGLSKKPPAADAVERLQERARGGERIVATGGGIWFYFPEGAGTSRLSPALIDRSVGSATTLRNWRTVLKLAAMAGVAE